VTDLAASAPDANQSQGLTVTRSAHVLVITISRPAVRNAIDHPTALGISAALDELDADDELRCAVITGEGSTFCAGMDLKAFAATGERPITESRGGFGIVSRPPRKPIIAAVRGAALGGGLEIALACDVIVAADDARFGLPEVKRGQVAGGGGAIRLPHRLPFHLAAQMLLTGEPISAQRAFDLGLVGQLVPAEDVVDTAAAMASQIAQNGPLAVEVSKQLLYASYDWSASEAMDRQQDMLNVVRNSNDAREGARAFAEKRPPNWTRT
jgi:enoyl-CoA hydratase/crotonobetainyl-CoA hydratase